MTIFSKIKEEYLLKIVSITNEYRTMLWHQLAVVNITDFNDFLRENSQFVRFIDIENMTYFRYYSEGVWNEADFSKMPLDYITEVFNQLERYCSN